MAIRYQVTTNLFLCKNMGINLYTQKKVADMFFVPPRRLYEIFESLSLTFIPSALRKSFKICFLKSLEIANEGHKSDSRNSEFFQHKFMKVSFRLLFFEDG